MQPRDLGVTDRHDRSLEAVTEAEEAAERGIALRDLGDYANADRIFFELIRDRPFEQFGWQELGVSYKRNGKPNKALYLFMKALNVAPWDVQPRLHCARHLYEMGRPVDADAVLAAHSAVHPGASDEDREAVKGQREFFVYMTRWPQARAVDLAQRVEADVRFLNASAIEAQILAAIEHERPFSLIRLGDGEGAWVRIDEKDEAAYPHLYAANRRDFLKIWFNDKRLHENKPFHAVAATLDDAVATADVLGMPYSLRVLHEYGLRSEGQFRGVPSTCNLLRWIEGKPAVLARGFCSQDVHLELQFAGFFRRLFARARNIGAVSCHAKLPALIAERTGCSLARFHQIPEEKGFSAIIGDNGIKESHFPSVFNRVMADLGSTPQTGMVWIIAAGFLGKLYCAEIRRRGGIALDVGSIVDGWLGKITRPTLAEIEKFVL